MLDGWKPRISPGWARLEGSRVNDRSSTAGKAYVAWRGRLPAPAAWRRWAVSHTVVVPGRSRRLESVPVLGSVWIYVASLSVIPCVVAVLLTSGLAHLVLLYTGGFLVVSSIVLASALGRSRRDEQPPPQQSPPGSATVRFRSPGRYRRRSSEGNPPACVVVLPVRVRTKGTGPNHLEQDGTGPVEASAHPKA
jgi:hypothetical protein